MPPTHILGIVDRYTLSHFFRRIGIYKPLMNADKRRLVWFSWSPDFYFSVFIINHLYKSGAAAKSPRAVHRGALRLSVEGER
jgi:hypothetical protein